MGIEAQEFPQHDLSVQYSSEIQQAFSNLSSQIDECNEKIKICFAKLQEEDQVLDSSVEPEQLQNKASFIKVHSHWKRRMDILKKDAETLDKVRENAKIALNSRMKMAETNIPKIKDMLERKGFNSILSWLVDVDARAKKLKDTSISQLNQSIYSGNNQKYSIDGLSGSLGKISERISQEAVSIINSFNQQIKVLENVEESISNLANDLKKMSTDQNYKTKNNIIKEDIKQLSQKKIELEKLYSKLINDALDQDATASISKQITQLNKDTSTIKENITKKIEYQNLLREGLTNLEVIENELYNYAQYGEMHAKAPEYEYKGGNLADDIYWHAEDKGNLYNWGKPKQDSTITSIQNSIEQFRDDLKYLARKPISDLDVHGLIDRNLNKIKKCIESRRLIDAYAQDIQFYENTAYYASAKKYLEPCIQQLYEKKQELEDKQNALVSGGPENMGYKEQDIQEIYKKIEHIKNTIKSITAHHKFIDGGDRQLEGLKDSINSFLKQNQNSFQTKQEASATKEFMEAHIAIAEEIFQELRNESENILQEGKINYEKYKEECRALAKDITHSLDSYINLKVKEAVDKFINLAKTNFEEYKAQFSSNKETLTKMEDDIKHYRENLYYKNVQKDIKPLLNELENKKEKLKALLNEQLQDLTMNKPNKDSSEIKKLKTEFSDLEYKIKTIAVHKQSITKALTNLDSVSNWKKNYRNLNKMQIPKELDIDKLDKQMNDVAKDVRKQLNELYENLPSLIDRYKNEYTENANSSLGLKNYIQTKQQEHLNERMKFYKEEYKNNNDNRQSLFDYIKSKEKDYFNSNLERYKQEYAVLDRYDSDLDNYINAKIQEQINKEIARVGAIKEEIEKKLKQLNIS